MLFKNAFGKSIVVAAVLTMHLLVGCNTVENPVTESQAELEGRIHFSKDMTEAEYLNALEILDHPTESQAASTPQPMALLANKTFTLTYQNHATISIGGVAYDRPLDQWYAGSTAGSTVIPPVLFTQLMASATKSIRVQIGDNPFPFFPGFALRSITVTMLDQGNQQISGLYDVNTREYLFLGAGSPVGGQVGNTSCGAISVGRLYGHFNAGITTIDGELSNGFIAGCVPVAIAASVSFFFSGVVNP